MNRKQCNGEAGVEWARGCFWEQGPEDQSSSCCLSGEGLLLERVWPVQTGRGQKSHGRVSQDSSLGLSEPHLPCWDIRDRCSLFRPNRVCPTSDRNVQAVFSEDWDRVWSQGTPQTAVGLGVSLIGFSFPLI